MKQSAGARLTELWLDKVRANARSEVGEDETIQAATYGQQTKRFISSLACFWKPRLFAVTQANVYVFKGGGINSAKTGELLAKRPIALADVRHEGRSVSACGFTIWPPPGSRRETQEFLDSVRSQFGSRHSSNDSQLGVASEQAGSIAPPGASAPPPA